MEQLVIGIRADGGAAIGMGHLMRCLSIAAALKDRQAQVVFLTSSADSAVFIREKGYACRLLGEACRDLQKVFTAGQSVEGQLEGTVKKAEQDLDMQGEVEETLGIIKELHMKLLVVDSYRVTKAYLESLRPGVKLIYIDDLGTMKLPVDGLINYNVYGDTLPYKEAYSVETLLLLGSRYAPVKKQFAEVSYEVRNQARNILITMGGSDSLNIAGTLADRLLHTLPEDTLFTLVCGRFSPHLEEVRALAKKEPRITVLTDVQDMWNVMQRADLAIAAAGSTMYELCTIGVPTICCYYVENQRRMAEYFGQHTAVINGGDFSKEPEQVLERIADETADLLTDFNKRTQLSHKMRHIADGLGAYRIAEELMHFMLSKG